MYRLIFASLALLCSAAAAAADNCPSVRQQQLSADTATRIAAIACNEHQQWYRPFIDTNGRIASGRVWEGEAIGGKVDCYGKWPDFRVHPTAVRPLVAAAT